MRGRCLKLFFAIMLIMLIGAPLSWAKETAFGYIIAYSYRDKSVYHTPIISQKVKGKSFSDEEYVSNTALIQDMERSFEDYLRTNLKVKSRDLTVSARPTYKTEEIAKDKSDKEVGNFRFKGFKITFVPDYEYSRED